MTSELDVLRLSHLIRRLVRETGSKKKDARDLVTTLGTEWPLLTREARVVAIASR